MIRRILTTCLMACIITAVWAAKLSKKLEITVGDETRSYWLYVPTGVKSNAPLVISLHGTSGHCEDKLTITHTRADGDLNISTLEIHTSSAEEEEALSIADVTPSADAPIYDLAGRRLQHRPTRGAYIQQGHKVLK